MKCQAGVCLNQVTHEEKTYLYTYQFCDVHKLAIPISKEEAFTRDFIKNAQRFGWIEQ